MAACNTSTQKPCLMRRNAPLNMEASPELVIIENVKIDANQSATSVVGVFTTCLKVRNFLTHKETPSVFNVYQTLQLLFYDHSVASLIYMH